MVSPMAKYHRCYFYLLAVINSNSSHSDKHSSEFVLKESFPSYVFSYLQFSLQTVLHVIIRALYFNYRKPRRICVVCPKLLHTQYLGFQLLQMRIYFPVLSSSVVPSADFFNAVSGIFLPYSCWHALVIQSSDKQLPYILASFCNFYYEQLNQFYVYWILFIWAMSVNLDICNRTFLRWWRSTARSVIWRTWAAHR